jgi:hypothetical protein
MRWGNRVLNVIVGSSIPYCLAAYMACLQASVNLATETALVKVMVPKGAAGQAALRKMGETLAQVGIEGSVLP